VLKSPLLSEEHVAQDAWGLLVHRTRASRLRMAAAMDHEMAGPEAQVRSEPVPDWARTTVVTVLDPRQTAGDRQNPRLWLVQPAVPARLRGAFVRQNPRAGLHDVEVRRLLPRAQGRVRRQPRVAGEDVVADLVHRWHGYL
jgi:hypothetical protein